MANPYVIVTGDRELNAMLRRLAGPEALRAHRAALREAAQIPLERAWRTVPVRSGAFRKSLDIRAGRRSRGRISVRVTQREGMMRKQQGSDRAKAFYGGFVEFGWRAVGRPRTTTSGELIKTYRGKTFGLGQLKEARNIRGQWVLRTAGKAVEKQTQDFWINKLWQWVREQTQRH